MKRLEGKTAIVTGASKGIGRSIARRLHSEGAGLILVSREADVGERFAAELGERVGGFVSSPAASPIRSWASVRSRRRPSSGEWTSWSTTPRST